MSPLDTGTLGDPSVTPRPGTAGVGLTLCCQPRALWNGAVWQCRPLCPISKPVTRGSTSWKNSGNQPTHLRGRMRKKQDLKKESGDGCPR